jgi:hypothetical protein
MILERAIYCLLAVWFFTWTVASIRSGESRFVYSLNKKSEDAVLFWVGVASTAFVAIGFVIMVFDPMPLGWPYRR